MQSDKLVRFVAELTPVPPIPRRPSIMIHCECKSPIYCAGKMDFYNPLLAHGCILLSLNGAFWLRNFRISLPNERSSKIDCLRRLDESAVIQLVHRNIKMDASVCVCLYGRMFCEIRIMDNSQRRCFSRATPIRIYVSIVGIGP